MRLRKSMPIAIRTIKKILTIMLQKIYIFSVFDSVIIIIYATAAPKDTPNAAYPRKLRSTWKSNQFDWRAGIKGWISFVVGYC